MKEPNLFCLTATDGAHTEPSLQQQPPKCGVSTVELETPEMAACYTIGACKRPRTYATVSSRLPTLHITPLSACLDMSICSHAVDMLTVFL